MAPTKMKLRVRRRESGGGGQEQEETSKTSSQSVSAEASPDSKCPICLDRFNNMSYLDRCLHRFCFRCIQEWSNNKVECPLCKQPFSSILHSIKAQDNFKEFTLRPPPVPGENGTAMIAAAEAAAAALVTARVGGSHGERRRTRRRGGGGGGGQGRGGRERRQSGRLWRGRRLSSAPPLPPLHPPLLPRPEDGGMRGEMDGEDPGVIFDGLTGVSAPPPHDRGVQRLMVRLAARRRSQREGRSVRLLRPREMLSFRRALYRSGVRVRNARGGCERPRDITAAFYQRNPVALHRLLPWLQRELTVLYGAHGSLVNIVQRIITSRIARHDMEGGGGAIQDELRPFLLARTDHFLHELISFARSPLSMEVYDQLSIYDPPAPSYEDRMTSSSSDTDDSVIAISDEEEEEGGSEGERERRPVSVAGSSALSQSAWDDETPGPSYSTAEPSQSPMPLSISPGGRDSGPAGANQNPAQDMTAAGNGERVEEGGEEEEGEQCMIVGFVKAMAERTPELVQLSSDPSDEEGEKQETKETVPQTALTPFSLVVPPLSIPVPPMSLFKNTSTERQGGGGERQGGGGERQGGGGQRGLGVRHLDREREQVEERLLYSPLGERREGRHRERSCSGSRSRSRHRSASVWSRSGRSRSSERSWSARSPVSVRSDDSSQERRRKRRAREREKRRREKGRGSHDRGSHDRGSHDRGSHDRGSHDRGSHDRGSHDRGSHRQHSREHRRETSGGSERSRGRERERIPYEPARSQYSNTGIFFSPENSVLSHSPSLSRSSQRGPESPGEHRHSRSSDSLSSSSSLSHLSVHRQHSRHSPRSDKPGGKRKYKSRHLEDPSWEPSSSARRERGRGGEGERGRGGEGERGRGGERERGRGGERERGRGGERERRRGGTEATASPRKSRGSLEERPEL
uniref:E3 ubiquitin-protein ligase Topors n=1 Tax=Oncorhynchus mykiss TaxID=8022 RepID=A0A8K9UCI2_ONCMY